MGLTAALIRQPHEPTARQQIAVRSLLLTLGGAFSALSLAVAFLFLPALGIESEVAKVTSSAGAGRASPLHRGDRRRDRLPAPSRRRSGRACREAGDHGRRVADPGGPAGAQSAAGGDTAGARCARAPKPVPKSPAALRPKPRPEFPKGSSKSERVRSHVDHDTALAGRVDWLSQSFHIRHPHVRRRAV